MRVRAGELAGFSARAGFPEVKEYILHASTCTAVCRASLQVFLPASYLAPLPKVDLGSTLLKLTAFFFVYKQSFQRRSFIPRLYLSLFAISWLHGRSFKGLLNDKTLFHLPQIHCQVTTAHKTLRELSPAWIRAFHKFDGIKPGRSRSYRLVIPVDSIFAVSHQCSELFVNLACYTPNNVAPFTRPYH